MSTSETNKANRERAYNFLLPTEGFGGIVTAFRPDPGQTLARAVPSGVQNSRVHIPGQHIPKIERLQDGTTVLSGHVQDATGKVVPAPAVILNVFRRPELVPLDKGK